MSRLLFVLLILSTPAIADTTLPVEAPVHRTVEYQEMWRTDPDSEDYLMGNIRDVVVDSEGVGIGLEAGLDFRGNLLEQERPDQHDVQDPCPPWNSSLREGGR